MAKRKKLHENAVLTIRSRLEFEQESPEWSELNTKAVYQYRGDSASIIYTDLDEQGDKIGETEVTVTGLRHSAPMVTVHKTGFTETLMILESGKTHPVSYETLLGTFHMQLHTLQVRTVFSENKGEIILRYTMNLGDSPANVNTVIMRVTMQAPAVHAVQHRST